MKLHNLQAPTDGSLWLGKIDPTRTPGVRGKKSAEKKIKDDVAALAELQSIFAAQSTHGLLIIFQAMDAAGKDGAIKHVMTGINPQGVDVHSFKAPSAEELNHDYLWRAMKVLPERGKIAIFNRSYYEEVLTVRVHPELLEKQKLPKESLKDIWANRFKEINNLERYLVRNGVIVLKFHLHISKEEQKKRLLERIDDPDKNYKITTSDITERAIWDEYMRAYEQTIRHTSTTEAPWFIIPSDHKWYTRAAVAEIIVHTLKSLRLKYPSTDAAKLEQISEARSILLAETT